MSILKDLLNLKKTLIINGKRGIEPELDDLLFKVIDDRILIEIKAIDIANYFLSKAKDEKMMIKNFHLQALVYLSQGISLAAYNIRLFNDDIYAWDFGPVIKELYEKTQNFGNGFVIEYLGDYAGKEIFEAKTKLILEKVWQDFFINYNEKYIDPINEISYLMRSRKSAWYQYFVTDNKKYCIIKIEDIASYHQSWITPK
jgi:uncharacterized phage-associated protein